MDDLAALGALAVSLDHGSLPDNLGRSLDFLRDATGADAAEIFVAEPDDQGMALTMFRGPFHRAFFEIPRFGKGEGYPGLVMARGQPILTHDLAHDGRYLRTAVKDRGFQAYVCVPCKGRDAIIGSLNVAFRHEDADLARALRVLTWASRPIGTALSVALLELRESARKALLSAGRADDQGLVMRETDVLGQLTALSGAESGVLSLLRADGRGVSMRVRQGPAPVHACAALEGKAARGCPAVEERRATVRAGPRRAWPAACRRSRRGGGTCYCLPLVADDRVCALAHLFFPRLGGRPPTWNLSAAELLADIAGEAIRDAWQSAERRRRFMVLGARTPTAAVPAADHAHLSVAAWPSVANDSCEAPGLEIRCLGPFELWRDGRPVDQTVVRRKKAITLLKLLLGQANQPVPKDRLIEALWPEGDPEVRTSQLHVLVHELRRWLEPTADDGWTFIRSNAHGYSFDLDGPCLVDVVAFRNLVQRGRRAEASQDVAAAIETYEAAAALYRGDFMEDEPYAEWCWQEREHLREVCLDALQRLATLLGTSGHWARSITHLRHALRIDRCREEVHREMMFSLWAAGRRDEAVRQYEVCRRLLDEELGVSPVPETERLLRRIRTSPKP